MNYNRNNNQRPKTNRKSKEEYEAEQAAYIAKQTKNLDILEDSAKYLEEFLKTNQKYKVTMKDILSYLNNEKQHTVDETKVVSQFNYLLMDLANARKNRSIDYRRLNIRVFYIEERLKTAFKKELHERIFGILNKYETLFAVLDETQE